MLFHLPSGERAVKKKRLIILRLAEKEVAEALVKGMWGFSIEIRGKRIGLPFSHPRATTNNNNHANNSEGQQAEQTHRVIVRGLPVTDVSEAEVLGALNALNLPNIRLLSGYWMDTPSMRCNETANQQERSLLWAM